MIFHQNTPNSAIEFVTLIFDILSVSNSDLDPTVIPSDALSDIPQYL
jgi:hypothetical protein